MTTPDQSERGALAAGTWPGQLPTGPAWLFCPADRPERWDKALKTADTVIIDLEDSVDPANKEQARQAVREAGQPIERAVLRINAAGTLDHERDVALLREIPSNTLMVPKAEDPTTVRSLSSHFVFLLVESPLGVELVGELAALPNVIGVMWGADDLVATMGGTSSRLRDGTFRDTARHARSRTLIAAKASNRIALDAVHMDITDTAGLHAACEDAAAIGFDATPAIHPSQVPVIRRAYQPSTGQVTWAHALIEAVGDDRSVSTFNGRMVDGPILRQAEQILRRHEHSSAIAENR